MRYLHCSIDKDCFRVKKYSCKTNYITYYVVETRIGQNKGFRACTAIVWLSFLTGKVKVAISCQGERSTVKLIVDVLRNSRSCVPHTIFVRQLEDLSFPTNGFPASLVYILWNFLGDSFLSRP